jgi:hypothetical protein
VHKNKSLAHFKAIEAYEVRPGILLQPRYTAEGEICEIALEKLHYSAGVIRLAPTLTDAEVEQIADQLVPSAERGPKPKGPVEGHGTEFMGLSAVTSEEYENISIQTHRAIKGTAKDTITLGDIGAATIIWKHRTCGQQTSTTGGGSLRPTNKVYWGNIRVYQLKPFYKMR